MVIYDTETIGFYGLPIIIQYQFDNSDVRIHDIWIKPIKETLELIKEMMEHTNVGFNLVFDHFHLSKIYTTLVQFKDHNVVPIDRVEECIEFENSARFLDLCLKPKNALDLMLHAQKGPYQKMMDRKPIYIRKVPTELAYKLCEYLNSTVQFEPIYFAKKKDKTPWQVEDVSGRPELKNVYVAFRPSSALKVLISEIFGKKTIRYGDVDLPKETHPLELGYAPFAKAIINMQKWPYKNVPDKFWYPYRGTWPNFIRDYVSHWSYNERARTYARDDVVYTKMLYDHFGKPEPGDDDSELAISVASTRWRGFNLSTTRLNKLIEEAKDKVKEVPVYSRGVKALLLENMAEDEQIVFEAAGGSTDRKALTDLAGWGGKIGEISNSVLDARSALKEIESCEKLLVAGRFHPSLNIIGAKSSRMSGRDGINAQGVKRTSKTKQAFLLRDPDEELSGGDFDAFEVRIFAAIVKDENLDKILADKTRKIHSVMGTYLWPEYSEEGIKATEGTDDDKYTKAKSGVFLVIYGGNEVTINQRLFVPLQQATEALHRLLLAHPGIHRFRKSLELDYSPITQPGGIGTRVYWREPKTFVESALGFKRYFEVEFRVAKALFDLANNLPEDWKKIKLDVKRYDRVQSGFGAVQSALYGAAFGIQGAVNRAAGNHIIQSSGAQITKIVQRSINDLQPTGIGRWKVRTLNIHDELLVVHMSEMRNIIAKRVEETVEMLRKYVPTMKIDWEQNKSNWYQIKHKGRQPMRKDAIKILEILSGVSKLGVHKELKDKIRKLIDFENNSKVDIAWMLCLAMKATTNYNNDELKGQLVRMKITRRQLTEMDPDVFTRFFDSLYDLFMHEYLVLANLYFQAKKWDMNKNKDFEEVKSLRNQIDRFTKKWITIKREFLDDSRLLDKA